MKKNTKLVLFKMLFALLGISAVVTEIATIVERDVFIPVNFFSFFTIQSNIFAVVMLMVGAFALYQAKPSKNVAVFRGAVTLYMLITGIVFALLLSGLENVALTAVPWDNIVLHYIMPIVLLIDWIVDSPTKALRFRQSLIWLIYPILYVVYSLLRGPVANWYPYPFLNPETNGYVGILIISIGILGLTAVLVWFVCWLSSRGKLLVK